MTYWIKLGCELPHFVPICNWERAGVPTQCIDTEFPILDVMAGVMSLFQLNVFGFSSKPTKALSEIQELPDVLSAKHNSVVVVSVCRPHVRSLWDLV